MPSIESPLFAMRKQEDICGRGVPALKRVGVAWMNKPRDILSYVSSTEGISFPWIPMETRMNRYCGVSINFPSARWRYPFSRVLIPKYPKSKSRSLLISSFTCWATSTTSSVTTPALWSFFMARWKLLGHTLWMLLAIIRVARTS